MKSQVFNILYDWCLHMHSGLGYGSVMPDAPGAELHPLTNALGEKVGKYVEQYVECMEKVMNFFQAIDPLSPLSHYNKKISVMGD